MWYIPYEKSSVCCKGCLADELVIWGQVNLLKRKGNKIIHLISKYFNIKN
jgi:hypothetical protein